MDVIIYSSSDIFGYRNIMHAVIHDRIFWIYFIITLFFLVIGISSILSSNDPNMIIIAILWLLSNIILLIIVYHAAVQWGPCNDNNILVCVVDNDSGCFESDNRIWLFINVVFISLLIISILWAAELGNPDAGALRSLSGILMLIGGLILVRFTIGRNYIDDSLYTLPFWMCVIFMIIWVIFTLYVILN